MGMVRDITETIDGVTYTTKLFPASEGLELGRRLARLVSQDTIAMALLSAPEEGEVTEDDDDNGRSIGSLMSDPTLIASLILGAAQSADAGEWASLCLDVLKQTTADKVRIGDAEVPGSVHKNFDSHFAGRYSHLFEVVVWAIRVGFGAP